MAIKRTDDTIYNVLDQYTGEYNNYQKVGTDLSLVDDIMYISPAEYPTEVFARVLPSGRRVNVKWFGASGDGSTDDYAAIQAAINFVQKQCWGENYAGEVYFPFGTYKITQPLIISYWTGSQYIGVSINLKGDSVYRGINATIIAPTFKNTFALGIQLGKGCTIDGLTFSGMFTPPTLTNFYTSTLEEYVDATCRDERNSPYTAIAIDPFNVDEVLPVDGGYPGLTSWYRGVASTSGSGGITIKNCNIQNFTVGIAFSINGFTQNGEDMRVQNVQFYLCKLGIAGSQSQEKSGIISEITFLGGHTFFDNIHYGQGTKGQWHISNVDIGVTAQCFSITSGGYFPVDLDKIYAENVGRFGLFTSDVGGGVSNSVFDFILTDGNARLLVDASGIKITNTVFRAGDYQIPIIIKGNAVYDNCTFGTAEILPYWKSSASGGGNSPTFVHCNYYKAFGRTEDLDITALGQLAAVYGRFRIVNIANGGGYGIRLGWNMDLQDPFFNGLVISITITLSGADRAFSFTPTDVNEYEVDELLYIDDGLGYARVSSIAGGVVTANYTSNTISNGVHDIFAVHTIRFFGGFMGDTTNGSAVITNVKRDSSNGGITLAQMVGYWVRVSSTSPGAGNPYRSNYAKILSYNSGAGSFTLNANSNVTEAAVYFSNAATKFADFSSIQGATPHLGAVPSDFILNVGSTIRYVANGGGYLDCIVTKTGLYDIDGTGDTRQAEWVSISDLKKMGSFTFSGDGAATSFDITGLPITPTSVLVTAQNAASAGITYAEAITSGIRFHYTTAPVSGANNGKVSYSYK